VSDIVLSDCDLTFDYSPNSVLYGQEFDLAPAPLRPSFMAKNHLPWIYADSVAGLELRNIKVHPADTETRKLKFDPAIENVSELRRTAAP
jgi:hypothetical protein